MQHLDADPDFVQSQAAAIVAAANEIHAASRQLTTLGGNEFQSKAMDAFESNVHQLITALDDAQTRYADTGHALTTYAPVLRRVQEEIDGAIAVVSHTDVNGAWHRAETAHLHAVANSLNPFASQSDKDEANLVAGQAKAHLEQQEAAVAAAEAKYDNAMNELHSAARLAANQIENGIAMSHLNDTFDDRLHSVLEKVHDLLSKALSIAHEILGTLSTILSAVGLALLLLSLIPIPGVQEILAGLGFAALRASTTLSYLDLAVQAARYFIGDINLGELISAALVAVASTFGGKFVVRALGKFALLDRVAIPELRVMVHLAGDGTGLGVNEATNPDGKDPIASFLDNHVLPDLSIPLFVKIPTSQDVGQLTPDFSHISVQEILNDSGISIPDSVPIHGSVLVA